MEARASAEDQEPELATPAEPRITTHKTGATKENRLAIFPRVFGVRFRGARREHQRSCATGRLAERESVAPEQRARGYEILAEV
jgi:hypothetical protein